MSIRPIAILVLVLGTVVAAEADVAPRAGENAKAVLPSLRRLDALKKADELLTAVPANSEQLTAELADPFYPGLKRAKDKKPEDTAPAVIDPQLLLKRAAQAIMPQGTMLIGTEPYLLLDGKRYKAGDKISVTVDGVGVQVTVSSIQRNSYTLRLDDHELRRDFK